MARYHKEKWSYNVPKKGDKKACLCRDNTYSRECCDEKDYNAQGIGNG